MGEDDQVRPVIELSGVGRIQQSTHSSCLPPS